MTRKIQYEQALLILRETIAFMFSAIYSAQENFSLTLSNLNFLLSENYRSHMFIVSSILS